MTVRVARDVGLERVAEYAERLGVYERMPPLAAFALGAGETGLTNLLRAYAAFANGGYRVDPVLVDRIQDRWGEPFTGPMTGPAWAAWPINGPARSGPMCRSAVSVC